MAAAGFRVLLGVFAASALPSCAPAVRHVAPPVSSQATQLRLDDYPWRITSIRGRMTPMTEAYAMTFKNGRFSARFGCNSFSGSYRMTNGVVNVSEVIQTVAGCPEPARTFEREGGAILSSPMQTGWDPETRSTLLFNGAGRIDMIPVVPIQVV